MRSLASQSNPWPVALADQTTDPSLDEAPAPTSPQPADCSPWSPRRPGATTGRPVDLFGFAPEPGTPGVALTPPRPWKAWR